eukprot:Gb_07761 [translate_table: standard]
MTVRRHVCLRALVHCCISVFVGLDCPQFTSVWPPYVGLESFTDGGCRFPSTMYVSLSLSIDEVQIRSVDMCRFSLFHRRSRCATSPTMSAC